MSQQVRHGTMRCSNACIEKTTIFQTPTVLCMISSLIAWTSKSKPDRVLSYVAQVGMVAIVVYGEMLRWSSQNTHAAVFRLRYQLLPQELWCLDGLNRRKYDKIRANKHQALGILASSHQWGCHAHEHPVANNREGHARSRLLSFEVSLVGRLSANTTDRLCASISSVRWTIMALQFSSCTTAEYRHI